MALRRRTWLGAAMVAVAGGARGGAPVRLLVAYPPGGVSDDAARRLAPFLSDALQAPVVLEHRPGAAGRIALDALARSAPDGRTLCYAAITPLALPSRRPLPRVVPVAALLQTPSLLVATPAFDGATLADVQAQARAAPDRLRWATSGVGTTGHLVLAQWCAAAGVRLTHVPYKGGGQQLSDAMAGQFELLLTNAGPLQRAIVGTGRLRPLAVGNAGRIALLPDVPTFTEAGYPGADLASIFGIFAPDGTPPAVVTSLNRVLVAALNQEAFRAHFQSAGSVPLGGSPVDFAERVHQEAARWRASPVAQGLGPG